VDGRRLGRWGGVNPQPSVGGSPLGPADGELESGRDHFRALDAFHVVAPSASWRTAGRRADDQAGDPGDDRLPHALRHRRCCLHRRIREGGAGGRIPPPPGTSAARGAARPLPRATRRSRGERDVRAPVATGCRSEPEPSRGSIPEIRGRRQAANARDQCRHSTGRPHLRGRLPLAGTATGRRAGRPRSAWDEVSFRERPRARPSLAGGGVDRGSRHPPAIVRTTQVGSRSQRPARPIPARRICICAASAGLNAASPCT
jgi:hypothetical protein